MIWRAGRNFFTLPVEEKLLFFEAVRISLKYRLLTHLVPDRWYLPKLGTFHKESNDILSPGQHLIVKQVYKAVRRSSLYLPFKEKCLIESIVAKKMLKNRGIESTLYLGVAYDDWENLVAHSWLRSGSLIITGKRGKDKFTAVEWIT
jgi:hypothetical protein